ncbi:hypothetical protein [Gymnodinialimonas sp.]
MQILYVLRGCLLAYGFGVAVMMLATMIIDGRGTDALGLTAMIGLVLLIPFLVIVVVIWAVLARLAKTVTITQAAAICAAVFFVLAFLLGLSGNGVPGLLIDAVAYPFAGAIFGTIFWVGAFGLRREMTMGTRMPEAEH